MKYRYLLVDRIPKQLQSDIVYHTEEFEIAEMLCACGCGHRITLLVPDGHQVWGEAGYATIRPSVGVLDAPCKSHFFVSAGNVKWLPAFSSARANQIMHAQIARHHAQDTKPQTWRRRAWVVLSDLVARVRAFFK